MEANGQRALLVTRQGSARLTPAAIPEIFGITCRKDLVGHFRLPSTSIEGISKFAEHVLAMLDLSLRHVQRRIWLSLIQAHDSSVESTIDNSLTGV